MRKSVTSFFDKLKDTSGELCHKLIRNAPGNERGLVSQAPWIDFRQPAGNSVTSFNERLKEMSGEFAGINVTSSLDRLQATSGE
jgi:hypothetical protein